MRHPLFLLIVICLGLAACAGPKPVPMEPLGLHFLPERGELALKSGEPAALADVDQLLRNADYILLGEGHTNVCDHAFQVQVLAYLLEGGQRPAVGLEMVGADMQPVLDRFSAGELPLESLPEALEWKSNWGYPFSLFAQHFELIRAYDLPVRALNAPRALVKAVSRDGLENLPGEDRALLPETVIPPMQEQRETLEALFTEHREQGFGSGELDRFLTVQSLWDTTMAQNAVDLRQSTGRPVVIVAGAGHVERGWGIAHRLERLDPKAQVAALVPLRDARDFQAQDGDAFFYCPPMFQSRMGMVLEARQDRILVVTVRPGSRADTVGIRPGDELVAAQGRPMRSFKDLHWAGKAAHDADEPLILEVVRRGERFVVDAGLLGKRPESEAEESGE